MTPEQLAYIARRRRQIRYWPWLAALLTLLLLGCYAYLFIENPIYVNPAAFAARLQAHQLGVDQLAVLAALGNLAFIACGLFILLLIVLTTLSLMNEARLIRILDEESRGKTTRADATRDGSAPPSHD